MVTRNNIGVNAYAASASPAGLSFPQATATLLDNLTPPAVQVPGEDAPVRKINSDELKALGQNLDRLFNQYRADRAIAELRWLRNLRQYLGFYDPELDKQLSPQRSRAYPKITRVKCISVLSRIMDLMFPGTERNWKITASPTPDMDVKDVMQAIKDQSTQDQAAGMQPDMDLDYVMNAIHTLAESRAERLSLLIDDQLQELGGDQTYDYVALNTEVVQSGIIFGLGILRGPFATPYKTVAWEMNDKTNPPVPRPKRVTAYKPMFEWLSIWDFYPDMSAKTLESMDGYFVRKVMSRTQLRALAKREDFFGDVIKQYITAHPVGNYRPQVFETELRAMGVKVNVNEMKTETMKYEVLSWHGPVNGQYLQMAGVDVPEDKLAEEIDAEIWLVEGYVIKAVMNPWVELDVDVNTCHTFLFDRDDTSVIGFGLPNVMRDTQMSICHAARMMMDNASVVCGPILELNTALLRPDQDLTSLTAYKHFYRDDEGPTSQWPAIREVKVDSHLQELEQIVELFMRFADAETFVGPATGGDMSQAPSEPMRTAAGASMLRGNAALPFKQIIRNFDRFTMSVIQSLVQFNRKFNPELAEDGDYDVIARGATSLMAKEIRGIQVDSLAQTLRPEEMLHVDERKLVDARLRVRDLEDLLVPQAEATRRQAAQSAQQDKIDQREQELNEANVRKLLSDAYKGIAQGQKNAAGADAEMVDTALAILEKGLEGAKAGSQSDGGGAPAAVPGGGGQPAPIDNSGLGGLPAGAGQGGPGLQPPGGLPGPAGQMPGLQ
jgi:hypothetical protein